MTTPRLQGNVRDVADNAHGDGRLVQARQELAKAMREKNWSIRRLARELHKSPSTVSRYLSGARDPSKATIRAMAELLGTSPTLWL